MPSRTDDLHRQGVLLKTNFLYMLLIVSHSSFAMELYSDSWKCTAYDSQNYQWENEQTYQLSALNRALESCKKESQVPFSCTVNKDECENFLNGRSTRPAWRCTALDATATFWSSPIFRNAEEASLKVKALCKEQSAVPETCYVNLLTCRNINQ